MSAHIPVVLCSCLSIYSIFILLFAAGEPPKSFVGGSDEKFFRMWTRAMSTDLLPLSPAVVTLEQSLIVRNAVDTLHPAPSVRTQYLAPIRTYSQWVHADGQARWIGSEVWRKLRGLTVRRVHAGATLFRFRALCFQILEVIDDGRVVYLS